YFRQFNPNVRGFPNQIFRYPTRPKPKSEKTRIFFGAHNRRSSWQPLMETFNKVLAGRDDIQFCVAGDEGFFEALDVRDKTVIPSKDYSVYMNALHASDIVLSPLEPSPQTNGKSDIKFLEAAICGAAMIASPTVYGDTIVQGETGLIARTYSDWTNGLTALIEKPELRRRLAANAGLYVRQHRMLMQHIHKRTDWYRELWAKREETNARLRETFPELR
ncbi:glycosyltransferase family protein, partial [Kordiimonas marina]|uniref:glycosyltransferase family protein n=1 Tax=Kordiimonas marina TaxID=2872312 RepID=UPI001FF47338